MIHKLSAKLYRKLSDEILFQLEKYIKKIFFDYTANKLLKFFKAF